MLKIRIIKRKKKRRIQINKSKTNVIELKLANSLSIIIKFNVKRFVRNLRVKTKTRITGEFNVKPYLFCIIYENV